MATSSPVRGERPGSGRFRSHSIVIDAIPGAAGGARDDRVAHPFRTHVEPLPTLADPPDYPRRHASHERISRDVTRDDGAGSDEAELAQGIPAEDRRVRPDGRTTLHQRLAVLVLARDVTSRCGNVGKDHRWTKKDVVLTLHAFVDADVILHFDVVAQARSRHDHDVLSQTTALSNHRAAVDVAEVPYARAPTDLRAFVDVARLVNEIAAGALLHFAHEERTSLENAR